MAINPTNWVAMSILTMHCLATSWHQDQVMEEESSHSHKESYQNYQPDTSYLGKDGHGNICQLDSVATSNGCANAKHIILQINTPHLEELIAIHQKMVLYNIARALKNQNLLFE